MARNLVYLMYHELELTGRPLRQSDPGYVRYVVREHEFREQIAHLVANNIRASSVGQALTQAQVTDSSAVVTFDDGCESDLLLAAPVLLEAGFGATFYVTVAHLGEPGCLSEMQLVELCNLGFEIGSHSLTHRYLPDLSSHEVRAEIVDSKSRLEQITGKPVNHFSCPGGRSDGRVTSIARDAGYASVVTSTIGANSLNSDRFCLSRVPMMRGLPVAEFDRVCRGEGLGLRRAQSACLDVAKRVLGNSVYDRLRAAVLGQDASAAS